MKDDFKKKVLPRTASYEKSAFTDKLGNMHMVQVVWWLPQKPWRSPFKWKTAASKFRNRCVSFHCFILHTLLLKKTP